MGKKLDPAIRRLRDGGHINAIAAQLASSRQAIYHWKEVPIDRVFHVGTVTGLSPYQLRPDFFPKGTPMRMEAPLKKKTRKPKPKRRKRKTNGKHH